jgi:hypothetical protein
VLNVTDAKSITESITALAAPFVAAFAVQQGTEIVSSVCSLNSRWDANVKLKKLTLSIASLVLATIAVTTANLDVLAPFLGTAKDTSSGPSSAHTFITIIFLSAGTEGFNSLLKWLSYKKDQAKAAAASDKEKAGDAVKSLAS